DLRAFVARRGERQDGVVVRLRQRIPHAVAFAVAPVGVRDARMHGGMMRCEPTRQRRTEVEADALEDASRRVRTVALGGNLLVEVAVVACAWLVGNLACKWVFTRRLIEVSVDAEILTRRCHAHLKPSGNDHFVGTRPQSGTSAARVDVDTSRPTGSLWNCSTIAAYCTAVCVNSRRRASVRS